MIYQDNLGIGMLRGQLCQLPVKGKTGQDQNLRCIGKGQMQQRAAICRMFGLQNQAVCPVADRRLFHTAPGKLQKRVIGYPIRCQIDKERGLGART
jgi:hypothetical protein